MELSPVVIALALTALFACAALVTWSATHPVRRLAELIGCIDRPDARKLHLVATPRLGGLAIVLGFALPLLMLSMHPVAKALVQKNLSYLLAMLASGSMMIVLGLYDDLFGSNATKKFAVQIAAAAILVGFDFHFDRVSVPILGEFPLGVFGPLLTIIWVVGVINAINFIDGMDGLLAIIAVTMAAAFATMATIRGDYVSLVIMTALAGSLAGFLPWNRAPARIFMGDSGSLFIGLLFAACSIARESKTPTALAIAGPFLALALPVLDTLAVMQGRLSGGSLRHRLRRLVNADRSHLHHRLLERYGSSRRALATIWGVTVLFGAAAVISVLPGLRQLGWMLGLAAALLLLVLRFDRRALALRSAEQHTVREPDQKSAG